MYITINMARTSIPRVSKSISTGATTTKKCQPGVICIESMTLMILLVVVFLVAYLFYLHYMKPKNNSDSSDIQRITVTSQNHTGAPNLYGVATRNDVFNDPYAPPLKNDGMYFRSDSSDIRGHPPPIQVPVNIETRGLRTEYSQVGILTNKARPDMILPLMGRRHMSGRDKWQYYSISNSGNLNTKLPISVNGRSCTGEYGCDQIMNGESVFVEGYQDNFAATVYETGTFHYLPL